MVRRWGAAIVLADGTLDRQAVADRVFSDREELAALGAITSPAIEDEIYRLVGTHHGTDAVVLLEAAPLSQSPGMYGICGLLVVDAPEDEVMKRLVDLRGMTEADARARMANQPTREARLANADLVIDNSGPLEHLRPEIEKAWRWLLSLPDGEVRRRA